MNRRHIATVTVFASAIIYAVAFFGVGRASAADATPTPAPTEQPCTLIKLVDCVTPAPSVVATPTPSLLATPTPTPTPTPIITPAPVLYTTPTPPLPTPSYSSEPVATPTPSVAVNPLNTLVHGFKPSNDYSGSGLSAALTQRLNWSGAGLLLIGFVLLILPDALFRRFAPVHVPVVRTEDQS